MKSWVPVTVVKPSTFITDSNLVDLRRYKDEVFCAFIHCNNMSAAHSVVIWTSPQKRAHVMQEAAIRHFLGDKWVQGTTYLIDDERKLFAPPTIPVVGPRRAAGSDSTGGEP